MKSLILIFIFSFAALQVPASGLIEVQTDSRTLQFPIDDTTSEFELDLGEQIQSVKILNSPTEMQVAQLFETSVTIQNEGPHWDLLDWKHGYTEATELEKTGDHFVVLPTPFEDNELVFPKVNMEDMVREVIRTSAPDTFVSLAKTCGTVRTLPCSVGVSRVIFQINDRAPAAGSGKKVKTVSALTPMGC